MSKIKIIKKLKKLMLHERSARLIEREADWLSEKRAHYILGKWDSKGWYDYGTVIDGGWLTVKGLSVMV